MMKRLPWLLWAVCVVLTLIALAFLVINGEVRPTGTFESPVVDAVFSGSFLMFPTVGALIAARLPANPIGWLFIVAGLGGAVGESLLGYATYALHKSPGSLPGGALAGLVSDAVWWPTVAGSITLMFLLFPNGRLLSRRWRWLVGLITAAVSAVAGATLVNAAPLFYFPEVQNPLSGTRNRVIQTIVDMGFVLIPMFLLGVLALAIRFRRSTGIERLQIRWLLYTAALVSCVAPTMATLEKVDVQNRGLVAVEIVLATAIATVPAAVGVAILRYRLYDIDVVINRTLVYGALTATLAATYLGSVLLLQLLLSPLTRDSGLAIAGSTLAVAGLFRPVRARIQALVDRRFYRRKYDAARTLETFGAHLRDELDLEALAADLRDVVRDTMQPAHVSLWLRRAGR